MTYAYLDLYYPPAPALEIRLGYPEESLKLGPFVAMLDTGADGTLVPQAWIDELGAPFVDDIRIRSHWGEWRNVQIFTVDLGVGPLRLPAVEVLGDETGDEIVLGRNVLNKLRLLLDGPKAKVELLSKY